MTENCVCGTCCPIGRLTAAALLVLLSAPTLPVRAAEGPPLETDPVVVTARRAGTPLSSSNRSMEVLTREEIAAAPVHSIEELLKYVTGVDLRRRGARGVQADVGIRGASFEQTLVLVDGIRVNDPQTGHHNLDIPVPLADIERIEILKGQASSIYGPNAIGGIIHIRTKRPGGGGYRLSAAGGEHGYGEGGVGAGFALGETRHRLSAEGRRSDGHRENTDFDIYTLSLRSDVPASWGGGDFSVGFTSRDFGANSFYTTLFPLQRERTKTLLARLGVEAQTGPFLLTPRLWWRHHEDRFLLDFTMPELVDNRHETDVLGAEIEASTTSSLGVSTIALEAAEERIDSASLGDRRRRRTHIAAEHVLGLGDSGDARIGGTLSHFSGHDWQFWPGFDAGWQVSESARIYASVEKSFRVPTYTELYYVSPANIGNPDLEAEEAWTFEVGTRWRLLPVEAGAAVFLRDASNLIDWIREDESSPWRAVDTGHITTRGAEAGLSWRTPVRGGGSLLTSAGLSYAFLDSSLDDGDFESKYVLDHLRHQLIVDLGHRMPWRSSAAWKLRRERRENSADRTVVDVRLRKKAGRVEVYVEGTNIFGAGDGDFPGVELPGRWITAGLKLTSLP